MLSKLTRQHLYIATPILMALIGAGFFFGLIRPKNDAIKKQLTELQNLESSMLQVENPAGGTAPAEYDRQRVEQVIAEARKRAETAKAAAEEEEKSLQGRYERIRRRKMKDFEDFDLSNPEKAMIAFWKEQKDRFPSVIFRFLQSTGCQLTQDIRGNFGWPPTDPNLIRAEPGGLMRIPLGQDLQIGVVGEYREILRLFRAMKDFDRLLLVSQVSIQGTSPNLQASFPLRIYLFPKGAEAQAAAAPPPGMGMGGMMGGPPGMPPMGAMGAPESGMEMGAPPESMIPE